MSKRLSDGSGGPKHMRKRRGVERRERDRAISNACDKAVAKDEWPSPALIASLAGVSEAVVSRRKEILRPARLRWVEKFGPHPQWGDGERDASGDTRDARIEALERRVEHLTARLDYAIALIRRLRKLIPRFKREAKEATAERDAFMESVRPPNVQMLVTRNATQEGKGDPGPVRRLVTRGSDR